MNPRPTLAHKTKLLIALTGIQRAAINRGAKASRQSVAAYVRGLIDERHHPDYDPAEKTPKSMKRPTHELTERAKWLYNDCKSITEMVARLRARAALLEEMRDGGVVLEGGNAGCDDYATLLTDNIHVATRFGFEELTREET